RTGATLGEQSLLQLAQRVESRDEILCAVALAAVVAGMAAGGDVGEPEILPHAQDLGCVGSPPSLAHAYILPQRTRGRSSGSQFVSVCGAQNGRNRDPDGGVRLQRARLR